MSFRFPQVIRAVPWGRGALPVFLAVFVWTRVGEAVGHLPASARWYLDDLLFLPLLLSLVLTVHRLAGRGARWCLPRGHGLAAFTFGVALFEGLLPALGRGTADPVDVIMYLTGWVLFEAMLNRPGCDTGIFFRSSGAHTRPRITPC